jgi:hypothetical protein
MSVKELETYAGYGVFWIKAYDMEDGEIDQYGCLELARVATWLYQQARPALITSAYTNKLYYFVAFVVSIKMCGVATMQNKYGYKSVSRDHTLPLDDLLRAEQRLLSFIRWHIPLKIANSRQDELACHQNRAGARNNT